MHSNWGFAGTSTSAVCSRLAVYCYLSGCVNLCVPLSDWRREIEQEEMLSS